MVVSGTVVARKHVVRAAAQVDIDLAAGTVAENRMGY
jgi:hypothetical protein